MSIARIQQLANKAKTAAEPAYSIARTEVLKQYETLMANNKQYVLEKPEQANDMLKKWFYTKMSRIPAGIDQCQKEADFVKNRFTIWKELSATEAGLYVAFGAELFAWFCVGEIVGRGGSINGYNI